MRHSKCIECRRGKPFGNDLYGGVRWLRLASGKWKRAFKKVDVTKNICFISGQIKIDNTISEENRKITSGSRVKIMSRVQTKPLINKQPNTKSLV